MSTSRRVLLSGLVLAALVAGAAQARVVEEQMDLPVKVPNAYGKEVDATVKLTVWSDDRNPRPAPVLVFSHGRAPEAAERAALGRARYSEASRYFVSRGFIVVVPTRIGYGVTGGEDLEDTGGCNNKDFEPGFRAAADQVAAALEAVRRRPDASPDRGVVVGQSFGGGTTVYAAARGLPGIQAAINFAGGSGGDPKHRPGNPCAPQKLEVLYGTWGRKTRIPELWIYTQNDKYFGAEWPLKWFKAYTEAGGTAELEHVPPHGEDGHQLFARFPEVWQPRVSAFLDAQGFPAPARGEP